MTLQVGYRDQGRGRPLVLLHGVGLDMGMWDAQTEALRKRIRVIPVSLPSHFDSPPLEAVASMDAYADAVCSLLDHLKLEQVDLGGLSMGGYVAFAFWRRHGSRVRRLLLFDTRAVADDDATRAMRSRAVALALERGSVVIWEAFRDRMFAEATADQPRQLVHDIMLRQPAEGCVADLLATRDRPDSTPDLPGITVPALVVVGAEDQITPVANSQAMASAMPNARLEIIQDAGHMAPVEQSGRINDLILDALS